MNQSMGLKHWAILLMIAAMFASSFFLQKIALESIPPLTISALRVLLAWPVCWMLMKADGIGLPTLGRDWIPMILVGVFFVSIPFSAVAWGLQHIESGLGAILMAPIPILTVSLAPFLTRDEHFTVVRVLGVIIGMGGVILVIGPSALGGVGSHLMGEFVTLIAPFCYALGGIYVRRKKEIPPSQLASGQFIIASIVLMPLSLAYDKPWRLSPTPSAIWSVAAIGVFSTGLPYLMIYWLIGKVGATNTSMLSYFVPIFAVGMGAAFSGEWLPWETLAGLGLILAGALAVGGRTPFRRGKI